MSETPVTPAAETPVENSTIRQMREEIRLAKAEAEQARLERDQAQGKLTEADRAKMDELERVRLEAEELKGKVETLSPLTTKVEQYETKFKDLFEKEMAKVPEAIRPQVDTLTQGTSFAERFERLMGAQSMIQTLTPIQEGNRTQPPVSTGAPAAPTEGGATSTKPMTLEEARSVPWSDAIMAKMPGIDLSKVTAKP